MPYPPRVFIRPMLALHSTGIASVTLDLGRRRPFLCWVKVTMIDSLTDFDRDNAIAAGIFTIDGVQQPTRVLGGDDGWAHSEIMDDAEPYADYAQWCLLLLEYPVEGGCSRSLIPHLL